MGKIASFADRRVPREASSHVRITNPDRHGFIEFQFSLGDPTLYLEMTLPPAAFADFCREHAARPLSDAQASAVDATDRAWRYGSSHEDRGDDD